MSKLAIIISSAIDVEGPSFSCAPDKPRSFFTAEERFRQTLGTIFNLRSAFPDAKIYLLDSGTPHEEYKQRLQFLDNLEFVFLKDLDSSLYETVKNHANKSFCESSSVLCFMENRKKELCNFDFVMKVSGRYLFDFRKNTNFEEKIYFKDFKYFNWKSDWDDFFRVLDNREEDGDVLGYACSAAYGFHTKYLEGMMDVLLMIKHLTNTSRSLDLESCLYYLTRHFKNDIINIDWRLTGYYGNTGKLVHW